MCRLCYITYYRIIFSDAMTSIQHCYINRYSVYGDSHIMISICLHLLFSVVYFSTVCTCIHISTYLIYQYKMNLKYKVV